MPLYVYCVVRPDGTEGDSFEVLQGVSDAPLTSHPTSREPVRRVITAPSAPRTWTGAHVKATLSDSNLDRLGFTKYKKAGDGHYEKTAGQGPETISRDD